MQATKKHETKTDVTKMQEKGKQKTESGNLSHQTPLTAEVSSPVRGSRDTTKHVSEVKHESHKDEYRRDHANAETGIQNPSVEITGKTEPVATISRSHPS